MLLSDEEIAMLLLEYREKEICYGLNDDEEVFFNRLKEAANGA